MARGLWTLIVAVLFVLMLALTAVALFYLAMRDGEKSAGDKGANIRFETGVAGEPAEPQPHRSVARQGPAEAGPVADPFQQALQMRMLEARLKREEEERAYEKAKRNTSMMVYKRSRDRPVATAKTASPPTATAALGLLGAGQGTSAVPAALNPLEGRKTPLFDTSPVFAKRLRNLHATITVGTIIQGVLETAIHSDLSGLLRAVVADNVYSFDGAYILIPKGSRLVGQYRNGLSLGQERVFVIWTRVMRPDGVYLDLDTSINVNFTMI